MNKTLPIGLSHLSQPPIGRPTHSATNSSAHPSFQEELAKAQATLRQEELHFSQHAHKRLSERGIQLSEQEIDRLNEAVDKVASKGGQQSVIMMRDLAFVVNIPNKTVITAMQGEQMKENIFTNIDSAMFV